MPIRLDVHWVIETAENYGWLYTEFNAQGGELVRLEKHTSEGRLLLNVWCSKGTVGSYLDHPRQGKTQLFRREVSYDGLVELLRNPRAHTGTGYHRKPAPPASSLAIVRPAAVAPSSGIACPFCKRSFTIASGIIQHIEDGGCKAAPYGHMTKQQIHQEVYTKVQGLESAYGATNLLTTPRLTNGDAQPATSAWGTLMATDESYDWNRQCYVCCLCQKGFETLRGLNSHLGSSAHAGNDYHCPQCSRKFATLHATVMHHEKSQCTVVRSAISTAGIGNMLGYY